MVKVFLILLMGISSTVVFANQVVDISVYTQQQIISKIDAEVIEGKLFVFNDNTTVAEPKHKKLKAVLLTILLGHFGVHRIYLGTSANVPVVYSLTLGGGLGVLPLLDLVAILTTKNLEQYSNNNQVFMWSKKKAN